MSDIIRLLPESIANQIAAGEVVTAPSAAVKELLENAIDAGATSIRLEVTDGGKSSIHVLDNGCGMSPSDARMAFEKHATSKIREASDLYRLGTMGFRGEALAAISAISQIELRTRRADHEMGTRILISGSNVTSTEAAVQSEPGTSIRVRNLFFNVPARRRFLGSEKTEFKKVLKEFVHVALVNPDIAMSISSDGKVVKDLPISGRKERILSIVGRAFDKKLLPIHYESDFVSISGYISHPQTATKRGYEQYMFVNNRYMKHPYFQKAVELAFEELIPEGHHPSFFIYFTVPPENIDVNISPTKTEIRFVDDQLIFPLVRSLVREALSASAAVPTLDFEHAQTIDIPAYTGRRDVATASPSGAGGGASTGYARRVFMGGSGSFSGSGMGGRSSVNTLPSSMDIAWDNIHEELPAPPDDSLLFASSGEATANGSPTIAHGIFCGTDYPSVGHLIYKGRYIVTSLRRNLILIDYRRAHARILYEQYMLALASGRMEMQQLLFPEPLNLSLEQAEMLTSLMSDITAMGFVLEPHQEHNFHIVEVPSVVSAQAATLLTQLIDHCIETGEVGRDFLEKSLALSMAELNARPYGSMLSAGDTDEFLAQLFATTDPNVTPRGEVIMTTLYEQDLDRRFS